MASFSSLKSEVFSREKRRQDYIDNVRGLNAYDRHKLLINDYVNYYGKATKSEKTMHIKTDYDVLKENYRFVRSASDDDDDVHAWEKKFARKYYEKLFKEYCLADMTRYKENKIGLRWRTEKEVISGKGQFYCGCLNCEEKNKLKSFEVNFVYKEKGEEKQALVKLRVCPKHGYRLHYRKNREKRRKEKEERKIIRKRLRAEEKEKKKRRKNHKDIETDSESESKSGSESKAKAKAEEKEKKKEERKEEKREKRKEEKEEDKADSASDEEYELKEGGKFVPLKRDGGEDENVEDGEKELENIFHALFSTA